MRARTPTLFVRAAWFLLVLVCFMGRSAASEADNVVIVANANDTASLEVAEYYAERRGIPERNILALDLPSGETISLEDYVERVHNPLLDRLMKDEWVTGVRANEPDALGRERLSVAVHEISYLVTVAGVPLRIANQPDRIGPEGAQMPKEFRVNRGSVDGELALLFGPPGLSMTALVPNPLFSKTNPSGPDAARVLRVSRLDGPSAAAVMRLVDRSLEAEEKGLMGRAYFDIGGPHPKGDEWINAAGDLAQAAHFDTDFETSKRPMDFRDRYDAPAIYMGWYRANAYGVWRADRWPVPPGAIAFHLHSFSAKTVRSTRKAWLGAFVNQGYCAMVGNVYEPYLEYTHRPQLLLASLLEGNTFGEAVAYSNPALSWMGVAIGDPLYRPFKVGLDAQVKENLEDPYGAYVTIRHMNRLVAEGNPAKALEFARESFVARPSLPLAFALARLHAEHDAPDKAVEALEIVRYLSGFSADEIVLVQKIADFLSAHGEPELALDLYQKLNNRPELDKQLRISLLEKGAEAAGAAGEDVIGSRWSLDARHLSAPANAD